MREVIEFNRKSYGSSSRLAQGAPPLYRAVFLFPPERAVGQSPILSLFVLQETQSHGSQGLLITSWETDINNTQACRLAVLLAFINGLGIY